MTVNVKKIYGNWNHGFALDKHMLRSEYLGNDEHGHAQFNNTRTEAGEAVYQLKYRQDNRQAVRLANAISTHIMPLFNDNIHIIVPMPASKARAVQPVSLVANELGKLTNIHVEHNLLSKVSTGVSLKDLGDKSAKLDALQDTMTVHDCLSSPGPWNVLIVDDLFDSGASMEVATHTLKQYDKIGRIYVAAMTWK